MKNQGHTPTPWTLAVADDEWHERSIWSMEKGQPVKIADHLKPEDAAFIVKAVNCREELLQVMRRVRSVLNDEGKEVLTKSQMENMLFQAIARAEGK